MKNKLKRSQSAHLRLKRINAQKANSAKTGTENGYYSAKVDYHNEVSSLQKQRKKILSVGERKFLFLHFLRKRGIFKDYRPR